PDGSFPVTNSEKGILRLNIEQKYEDNNNKSKISCISGGAANNIVPELCEAKIEHMSVNEIKSHLNEFDLMENIEIESSNGEIIVKAIGKTSHSSVPENGENAITILLNFLHSLPLETDPLVPFLKFYTNYYD